MRLDLREDKSKREKIEINAKGLHGGLAWTNHQRVR
jgi:hypothetical protein